MISLCVTPCWRLQSYRIIKLENAVDKTEDKKSSKAVPPVLCTITLLQVHICITTVISVLPLLLLLCWGCCQTGTAGLLIDIECFRVRDSLWMYLTSFVTTRIGVELAAAQWKLPNCVVVGLQLYSARTFHVTLSPWIYKGRQGPPPNIINTQGNTNNHKGHRVLRNSRPEPI